MKIPKLPQEIKDAVQGKKKPEDGLAKTLEALARAPPSQQCCVGLAAGLVNGFVFGRLGKNAAVIVGGSLVMLQVASYMGYIKINWKTIEKDLGEVKKEIAKPASYGPMFETAKDFLMDHVYLGGGFVGGFVVGLVTS
ncbi:FUN14 domain-containing protein 1B [Galendromus occidentalis]|uniref:FUN14 domain-containing protein 1B n=1 Tax=Galendromus occidentalis TaxID=34638 RepID=A0AAJ6QVN9_9ACAR|nr:FUN14 domain-containing protein 1B [Galendromus occidentalis]